MCGRKNTVRRRFAGGGAVTLLLAGVLAVLFGGPTTPVALAVLGWLAIAGSALLVAGVRERISLGATTVGWPRVAAFGLATLALGSTTLGFARLFGGGGGWALLNGLVLLLVGLVLVRVALECWLGGVRTDEETFAVE